MGKTPSDIEQTMNTTRDKIAGTIDDLKTKVGDSTADVQDRLSDGAASVRAKVGDAVGSAVDALPNPDLKNPIPLLVGAAIGGFAIGLIVPLVALERERLQPVGDEIARRASRTRDEVTSQSLAVVSDTVAAAKESAQTHGKHIAETLGG